MCLTDHRKAFDGVASLENVFSENENPDHLKPICRWGIYNPNSAWLNGQTL